jgi:hypothetical protein
MFKLDSEVCICHSYCDANVCADTQANMKAHGGLYVIYFDRGPAQVSVFLFCGC